MTPMTHGLDLLGGGDEPARVRSVTEELVRRYGRANRSIPASEVEARMNQAVSNFEDARIRDFVPILAQKEADAALRRQASGAE